MTHSLLPTQKSLAITLVGLIALMGLTRGDILGSTLAFTLHDASWAVFLLGGMLLRRWGWWAMFATLALALDLQALCQGSLALASCLRPSYPTLMLSWALLWFAGRVCSSLIERARWASIALVSVLATVLVYVVSNSGFYAWSGFYADRSIAGFVEMAAPHFARALVTTLVYAFAGLTMLVVARYWRGPADTAAINGSSQASD